MLYVNIHVEILSNSKLNKFIRDVKFSQKDTEIIDNNSIALQKPS